MNNVQEIVDQERDQMLNKLYTALNSMKGHEILANNQTENGFNGDKIFEHFDWSLFKSSNGILKISLENDLDYDSNDNVGTLPVYFKVDEVKDIEIDDNLDENDEFLEDELIKEYTVENIWVTLKNNDVLRLQLEW